MIILTYQRYVAHTKSPKHIQSLIKRRSKAYCGVCDIHLNTRAILEQHFKGKRHRKEAKKKLKDQPVQPGPPQQPPPPPQQPAPEQKKPRPLPPPMPRKISKELAKLKKTMTCDLCGVTTVNANQYAAHLAGKKHLSKSKQAPSKTNDLLLKDLDTPCETDLYLDPKANKVGVSAHEKHMTERALAEMFLNESQKHSIRYVMGNVISLIHGPPGTGKTTTVCHLIKIWVDVLQRGPVLATAYSNVAVDQLLLGLKQLGIKAVRLGDPAKINEELKGSTMTELFKTHRLYPELVTFKARIKQIKENHPIDYSTLNRLYGEMQSLEYRMKTWILDDVQVVCSTCVVAGSSILAKREFTLVTVDECTQATEPSCLIPICKAKKKVVFIGDQCQLPPTINSNKMQFSGLATSLFERMLSSSQDANLGISPVLLTVQYRMNPWIAYWSNNTFYRGTLQNGVTEQDRLPPVGFPWVNTCPVAFVEVEDQEDQVQNTSKRNTNEAKLVVRIVNNLINGGQIKRQDIGVITPYMGQVRAIREQIKDNGLMWGNRTGVEVKSVDGFQGREKEVIVLSCVRSNFSGAMGFLNDFRRLNVAITRAKRGLVVVGNQRTLSQNTTWKSWLDFVSESNLILNQKAVWDFRVKPVEANPRRQTRWDAQQVEANVWVTPQKAEIKQQQYYSNAHAYQQEYNKPKYQAPAAFNYQNSNAVPSQVDWKTDWKIDSKTEPKINPNTGWKTDSNTNWNTAWKSPQKNFSNNHPSAQNQNYQQPAQNQNYQQPAQNYSNPQPAQNYSNPQPAQAFSKPENHKSEDDFGCIAEEYFAQGRDTDTSHSKIQQPNKNYSRHEGSNQYANNQPLVIDNRQSLSKREDNNRGSNSRHANTIQHRSTQSTHTDNNQYNGNQGKYDSQYGAYMPEQNHSRSSRR